MWTSAPLGIVAPRPRNGEPFAPEDDVWLLNLDMVESQTGRIIEKTRGPVDSAGSSTAKFEPEDVLYSKLRPYLNKVVVPDEPGLSTTELVALRPSAVLDRYYLAYYLRSPSFVSWANANTAGAKMPRVVMELFWSHEIPLPPPSEQRRIVDFLDQADRLRQIRAKADSKAERILPALFIKMFGNSREDWRCKRLDKLLLDEKGALQSGPFGTHLHNSDFIDSGEVLAVGIDNVTDSGFVVGRGRRISRDKHSQLERFTLKSGDVLITIMGTIGRCCVFPIMEEDAICTKHVYRIQVGPELLPEYLAGAIRYSPDVRRQLGASSTGQIVSGITSKHLKALTLVVPPRSLQRRYRAIEAQVTAKRDALDSSAQKLDILFNTLMHRAFTGDLTAGWREAHMAEMLQEMEHQAKALARTEVIS